MIEIQALIRPKSAANLHGERIDAETVLYKGVITKVPPWRSHVKSSTRRRISAVVNAQLMYALMTAPRSYEELIEITGLHRLTLSRYIKAMWEAKVVHVSAWVDNSRGNRLVPAFQLGDCEDATKPKPKPSAQSSTEYRARIKTAKLLGIIGDK